MLNLNDLQGPETNIASKMSRHGFIFINLEKKVVLFL